MIKWKNDKIDKILFSSLLSMRKLHLISLLFVHYSVIRLRYFWWNYFLNNFCLLIGLLRLVCLFMVGQWVHSYFIKSSTSRMLGIAIDFLMTNVLQEQFLFCFKLGSNQHLNLNIFSVLFLQTFLLINLISLSSRIFCQHSPGTCPD